MRSNYQDDPLDDVDIYDQWDFVPKIKNVPPPRNRRAMFTWPKPPDLSNLVEEEDRADLKFTYRASKSEVDWLNDSLGSFYQQEWFDDVLRIIKGGKEASVYHCEASPTTGRSYLAAKVYRPRRFRQLKNDTLYREGRERLDEDGNAIINGGMHHAMNKGTGFGRQLMHTSWLEHEVRTMRMLHQAGGDVPEPIASGHNAILMDYIGGPEMAAPTLNTVESVPPGGRVRFSTAC